MTYHSQYQLLVLALIPIINFRKSRVREGVNYLQTALPTLFTPTLHYIFHLKNSHTVRRDHDGHNPTESFP